MKKLFYLLLFFPVGLFAQTQIVNVGTAANSGDGDPLRTAFQKVNLNTIAVQDSFGNIYREVQTRKLYTDSTNARVANAYDALDYFFPFADSNSYGGAITRTYFETFGGGGGGASMDIDKLEFIIGTTSGAPPAGDSVLTNASLAGRHVEVIRDGLEKLYSGAYLNGHEHFRFNSTTGAVTVHPPYATGEEVIIKSYPSSAVSWLSLTGGGSSLLTGLVAGWQFNEPSGSYAFDVTDNESYIGLIYGATPGSAGKFGNAFDYDGTNDYVDMGTDNGLEIQTMSISCWVKTTQAAYAGIVMDYYTTGGVYYGYAITLFPDGTVEWGVRYGATNNICQSSSTVNDGNWHNIIVTFDGTNTNIYIDNGSTEDTDATAGTIQYHASNTFHVGNRGPAGTDLPFDGLIDDVYLWSKVLSAGERTTLQTGTYPW